MKKCFGGAGRGKLLSMRGGARRGAKNPQQLKHDFRLAIRLNMINLIINE
jgi:hypothetical protein